MFSDVVFKEQSEVECMIILMRMEGQKIQFLRIHNQVLDILRFNSTSFYFRFGAKGRNSIGHNWHLADMLHKH